MTFFDYWKSFNALLEEHTLPPTAQLIGYKLLAKFNKSMFPASIFMTDRELQDLTQIKSLKSIHSARALLKEIGFIDFAVSSNKPTKYSLCEVNTKETPSKHEVNTKETPSKHEVNTKTPSIIRACEDVIDGKDGKDGLEVKTERQEEATTATAAGAREAISRNSEAVRQAWLLYVNEELKGGYALDMIHLESVYGASEVVEAIKAAGRSNTRERLSYNYVKKILENRKGGQNRVGFNKNNNGGVDKPDWVDAAPTD